MTKLININPEISKVVKNGDSVVLDLIIHKDLDYFKGHFPQSPILAGVVQLNWAVEYGFQYLEMEPSAVQCLEVLKFQVVIRAGISVKLTLLRKTNNKFSFSYHSDAGQYASGRIVLG